MLTVESIPLEPVFTSQLPQDSEPDNHQRQVFSAAFSYVYPVKPSAPKLIHVSDSLANDLGFSSELLNSSGFLDLISGRAQPTSSQPYAMCYGGHQFGHWAGQLGDGRAINLGELKTANNTFTLQLKGAGPTPYSRTADGMAVLRSSVREYLCSEAMYHLGIPTTRALSLTLTGDEVVRDIMYSGDPKPELGAIVCRVSPSFLRFGSFQLPSQRKDINLLQSLVDYSLKHNFTEIPAVNGQYSNNEYCQWFEQICERTANVVVEWMRVGFVHGVLNTDNMSIIGETIDYGPYGWIDNFDLNWTPNTTDAQHRRYRFGAQAEISFWNLYQLANAIVPLVEDTSRLQAILDQYQDKYLKKWQAMMANKLGLTQVESSDTHLFTDLENMLSAVETDMTIFYRLLATLPLSEPLNEQKVQQHFLDCYYQIDEVKSEYMTLRMSWLTRYQTRWLQENSSELARQTLMNKTNPNIVLRNYLTQQAIDKAEAGDFSEIEILAELIKTPYDEHKQHQAYLAKRPDWARNKVGCSMLSCSS